jgi:Protein of unknown function (DUF3043)
VFRRRSSEAPDLLEQDHAEQDEQDAGPRPGQTPAKGRPTPKRSQAEARRRQPYSAPADRKSAARQGRDQSRTSRTRQMEAMRRGEEWALPRKDKGPVRKLARDVVDSRRGLAEYYIFSMVALVVLIFVPGLRALLDYLLLLIIAVIVGEGWWVSRKVVRLAQQRYPGESTRGVRLYTAMRGTQLRRLRMPPPTVSRGDKV